MRPYWWDALSDGELRARLTQRGVDVEDAFVWVAMRERSPVFRARIADVIGAAA